MNKDLFIANSIRSQTYYWWGVTLILGIFLFLLLGVMDYFVTPANFDRFFVLRTSISIGLFAAYLLNRWMAYRDAPLRWLTTLIVVLTACAAVTIEVMILDLGGHASYYYAGLNLLAICVLGLNPLGTLTSAVTIGIIYLIYLVPIFLLDEIQDPAIFVSHNFFLLSTFIIALVWRHLAQNSVIKTLELQWETGRDKEKLEEYSDRLELLVEERTRDLKKSEQLQRTLYEHANDIIIIMDATGTILDVNHKAQEVYGFDRNALIGANVSILEADCRPDNCRRRLRRILAEESLIYETIHRCKDGTDIALEVSTQTLTLDGKTIIQSFHRDVTEKQKFQRQLLHSQKMDSIGQLAGGISHELNNILASMLGQAEVLMMREDLDGEVEERLHRIERAGRQGSQIVSRLLSFSRKKAVEMAPFGVNNLIADTLGVVAGLMPSTISVVRKLREPLPTVNGDVSQIDQVFMNLLVNARDAMSGGGEITVRTDEVELGAKNLDVGATVVPGRYVTIEVTDTGTGISDEHISRIFDPFYTTKSEGKGTGLGLAMVYGIVKDHRGYITVSSEVGGGTSFCVYLPVATAPAVRFSEEVRDWLGGTDQIVLVVEDEFAILDAVGKILETHGYRVLRAETAEEARRILEVRSGEIDALVTDVTLGRDSGVEIARQARACAPNLGVVLMTGNPAILDADDRDGIDLLVKPFQRDRLLAAVRNAIRTSSPQ